LHTIHLSNLSSSTAYHFRVISTDQNGNTSTSSDQTFTTFYLAVTTENDTTPPTISNVQVATISDTQVTIIWQTDELSTSQVIYGTTDAYGSQTTQDPTLTFQHSVTISGLTKETTYHYKVISKDAAGNTASSTDYTFTTTQTPETITIVERVGGGVLFIEKEVKPDKTPPIISNIEIKEITYTSVSNHYLEN
jgi:phosphodiesterase/alkaline phosphatase D-like protein